MALTPQAILREYILEALSQVGGSADRSDVLNRMNSAHSGDWTPEDLEAPNSRPFEKSWQNRASWERNSMVRAGLLQSRGDGVWALALPAKNGGVTAVPSLSDLTQRSAVFAAMDEYRQLGRAAFLERYGFEESRIYFVREVDEVFDSKPIVAAALANEHPESPRLTANDFSGGVAGAVRVLERLGFEVVTRAQLSPPVIGSSYPNRTAIAERFGGDKIGGVIRFPGEAVVNIFSDAESPYADDPPTLTEAFGYRGAGLSGPQDLAARGNAVLEESRVERDAARFWYRPAGGVFTFQCWVAVLGRSWTSGTGQDGLPRPEIRWVLQAVAARDSDSWPDHVVSAQAEAAEAAESLPNSPEAKPAPTYKELMARVDAAGQAKGATGVVRTNYPRSAAARRAVLIRSDGQCESPWCTGQPNFANRRGEPILDVDHIIDLAKGGEDRPLNMVALCPNCHAVKTRSGNAATRRRQLLAIALAAHAAAVGAADA